MLSVISLVAQWPIGQIQWVWNIKHTEYQHLQKSSIVTIQKHQTNCNDD